MTSSSLHSATQLCRLLRRRQFQLAIDFIKANHQNIFAVQNKNPLLAAYLSIPASDPYLPFINQLLFQLAPDDWKQTVSLLTKGRSIDFYQLLLAMAVHPKCPIEPY
jgi:hypothetical protein